MSVRLLVHKTHTLTCRYLFGSISSSSAIYWVRKTMNASLPFLPARYELKAPSLLHQFPFGLRLRPRGLMTLSDDDWSSATAFLDFWPRNDVKRSFTYSIVTRSSCGTAGSLQSAKRKLMITGATRKIRRVNTISLKLRNRFLRLFLFPLRLRASTSSNCIKNISTKKIENVIRCTRFRRVRKRQ